MSTLTNFSCRPGPHRWLITYIGYKIGKSTRAPLRRFINQLVVLASRLFSIMVEATAKYYLVYMLDIWLAHAVRWKRTLQYAVFAWPLYMALVVSSVQRVHFDAILFSVNEKHIMLE